MNITYDNPPLLELVVELQWDPDGILKPSTSPIDAPVLVDRQSSIFENWQSNLLELLEEQNYNHLERLVPDNFPPISRQPIYRFRQKSSKKFPLIQFGHGIFTINAGPPEYVDWKSFRPNVEKGLDALLKSKPSESQVKDFTFIRIRYIDGFREDLRGEGVSTYSFMKNDLQASINLPSNVLDLAADENEIAPNIALRFPVKDKKGLLMNIQIADGKVENEPATIMEMNSTATEKINIDLNNVLSILDDSQKILHSTFLEMTKNIEDRMNPIQHKE